MSIASMETISEKTIAVNIESDLDLKNAADLQKNVNQTIDEGKINVIINLENVRYIDSSGLTAIANIKEKSNEKNGDALIVCSNSSIRKIFDITGLDEYIKIFDAQENAVKAFEK